MLEDFRRHDLPSLIAKIEIPTLVFHSPVDSTVGFDHALRIMGMIQGSSTASLAASLVTLHGSDHLLADRNEDLIYVAETTAAFVQRYAGQQ
jgi:putative redox protein